MAPATKFAVGCTVQLRTQLGEVVGGEIFAYDPRSDTVVLKQQLADSTRCSLRLVRGQQVRLHGAGGGGERHRLRRCCPRAGGAERRRGRTPGWERPSRIPGGAGGGGAERHGAAAQQQP